MLENIFAKIEDMNTMDLAKILAVVAVSGIIIIMVLIGITLNSSKKQRALIKEQKTEINARNKEITKDILNINSVEDAESTIKNTINKNIKVNNR